MHFRLAYVRLPLVIFLQLFLHSFELSAPHIFQVHVFRLGRRRFIEEDRNSVPFPDFISHIPRQRHAIIQGDALHRNKRHHIGSANSRMRTLVNIHVNQFHRFARAQNRRLGHRIRLPRQSNHAAIVIRVHLMIQHPNSRHRAHGLDQRMHLGLIAPLTKIWHTLNQSSHIRSFGPACRRQVLCRRPFSNLLQRRFSKLALLRS